MTEPLPTARPQRREHPDPHEARHPIPLTVTIVVAAMLGWAVGYLMAAQPNTPPALGDLRTVAEFSADADASQAELASVDGAQLYASHCAACHQPTGTGIPQVFPPLAGSEWVEGDAALLLQILLHGVQGPIEVAGQSYNGVMPAFGGRFSDVELAALASHLRSAWGNSASTIAPATVELARAATRARSTPWSGGAELHAFGTRTAN